jgi:c-di-GMP-binding flagellar brake protein YcgR
MKEARENRRSFRISEPVYVKYEPISDEEFELGLEHRKLRLGINDGAQAAIVDIDARLGEAMFLLNSENSRIGRCLQLLSDKLSIVAEQLPSLRKTKASLAASEPQTCDVGADGMVFSSNEQLEVDSKLHLQFLLSSDNRYVETFCRVVRMTESPDMTGQGFKYGVGVEFLNMPSTQREILIQHMFNRESESLRMRRLEIDDMEARGDLAKG